MTQEVTAEWTEFLTRVKKRPPDFYAKCIQVLSDEDIYEPSDLAEADFDTFKRNMGNKDLTAGQRTFLEQCVDMAKAEKLAKEKAAGLPQMPSPAPATNVTAPHSMPAQAARIEELNPTMTWSSAASPPAAPSAAATASTAATGAIGQPRTELTAPVERMDTPVAALVLPGNEAPDSLMRRGGIEIQWKTGGGAAKKVTKYREVKMRHVVDQDLALPVLYLHFLGEEFFLKENEYNLNLRSGNDNSELQVVLPLDMVPKITRDPDLQKSLDVVMKFMRSQSEVMASGIDSKPGGFGPKQNYKTIISPERLYFTLRTARPKAPISLDKVAFGIPETAELYLFAENHISVAFMSDEDQEAFEKCISEMPGNAETKKFGIFLKVFYEGAFAYNSKIEMGRGYLPKNIAIACMDVSPAFEGQSGIGTGYPYLLESRFLPFIDTVPVTIRGISEMSERHRRYGLAFTRCVFVWEGEAFAREGVLNFCSVVPHGGFYYVPATLREHDRLGGLIYAFGEAKDALERPAVVDDGGGGTAPAPAPPPTSSRASTSSVATVSERRVCVVCLDQDACFASLPCGHKAFCATCKDLATSRACPVCRTPVTSIVRIFD